MINTHSFRFRKHALTVTTGWPTNIDLGLWATRKVRAGVAEVLGLARLSLNRHSLVTLALGGQCPVLPSKADLVS